MDIAESARDEDPTKTQHWLAKVYDGNAVGIRKKNTNDITRQLRQFVSRIIVVSRVILPTVITVLVRSSLSVIKIKNRYEIHRHTPFVKQLSTRRTSTKYVCTNNTDLVGIFIQTIRNENVEKYCMKNAVNDDQRLTRFFINDV